ncbi:MAG: HAD hydrolase family protein [Bacteroidota bacterium]|nr:HAD hydrolase family protein [Bacteroidota bacterium]
MSLYAANLSYLLHKNDLEPGKISSELGIKDLARPFPDEIPLIASRFALTTDLLLKTDIELREDQRSKEILMLICDIDGVMTDGGMYYTEAGDDFKKFNAKDGLALRRLKKRGVNTGIISHGFTTNLITRRAERLYIEHVEVSSVPKMETLKKWCDALKISPANICFIGDDINDEDIIKAVGFSACPADAVDAVKNIVNVVLTKKGGEGCVRELIDLYL